ncbi:MAG: ATP-binding protein, partial [Clostridia bacterium]|nr:ATP-binding protein [Clostridia bacterium]
ALECEKIMHQCVKEFTAACVSGSYSEELANRIQAKSQAVQEELASILRDAGESVSDFTPQYTCKKCNDTGKLANGLCDCLQELLTKYNAKEFTKTSKMTVLSLDDMQLDFYSGTYDEQLGCVPREHMQSILEYCRCYGEDFSLSSDSLLLSGPTGVGKTHAALSIAGMAANKGYCPVYHSAQSIFHKLEKEHFGKAEGDSETLLSNCDLLILDDLGTEMTTAFTLAELYEILNNRMLSGLPTIISTNLTPADWQSRYGEAIASRVLGTFQPLLFVGKDIRQQKLERRLSDS